ncbi:MAG: hypothetical protein ACI8TP_001060 [Acidimicrobiales bacterium]|jgi:hypothetical protein
MFKWDQLDTMTRAAVGATGAMLLLIIIPPFGLLCGVAAMGLGAVAFRQAGADGRANPTAQWCMMISGVVIFLLIAGNILYARS